MNLKRVAIQLENGLNITLKLLPPKEGNAIYKKYLATSEPSTLIQNIYRVTFKFMATPLYAFCYADAVSLILQMLGGDGGMRALDYFACFVINNQVIYSFDFNKPNPVLTLLKQSVEQNVSPNIAALLNEKARVSP
jgi:hypothetical protein